MKWILFGLFFIGWGWLINYLFATPHLPDYPFLRERFGTIMWHSSDANGEFLGGYKDPQAIDHIYCYYPKGQAQSKIIIKRVDNMDDCRDWDGAVVFREAEWASEREKYWWSAEQYAKEN